MCLPKGVRGATIQSLSVAIGNLLCLNFGILFGITPAHMSLYESEKDTPLNTVADAAATAWLTGYLFLGAALGAAFAGCLSCRIGPKSVLLCAGLFQILSWFSIHFGFDIVHIHASRIFGGFSAGAAFVVLPIFINEIAETRDKAARLTFTIELWRTLGILLGFVLGFYVSYAYVNIVGCITACLFSLCFPFVRESPLYYLRKGNMPCLEKSLRWYRGIRDIDDREKPEYLHELAELRATLKEQNQNLSSTQLSHNSVVRLIAISFLLSICAISSGAFVELNYASDFLGQTSVSMEMSYVLLALVQCLGALLGRLIGLRLPRKVLLSASSLLAAIAIIALALVKQFGIKQSWGFGGAGDRYLPTVLLAAQLLFVSLGPYSVAAVISSEMLPSKIYALVYSFASAVGWLLLFGMIEGFNAVKATTGHGVQLYLWIFAAASIFVGLASLPLLPETRNRRPSAIQRDLGLVGAAQAGGVARITSITNGHSVSHI